MLTILRLRLYISASDEEIIPDDGPPPLPVRQRVKSKSSGSGKRKRRKTKTPKKDGEDVPGNL